MQHRHLFKACFTIPLVVALLAGAYQQVRAADDDKGASLVLREIMKDLGKDMQIVTDGISREDWALVAETAPRIADHPQPPMGERLRILAFVGSDAGRFKEYDKQTQQAARILGEAAAREDGMAVISAFASLQETCLACHQQFRKPFQEHFDG